MNRYRLDAALGTALLLSWAWAPAWARGTCDVQFDSTRRVAHVQILDQVPPDRESVQDGWTSVTVDAPQQTTLRESDQPELPYLEYWISVPGDAKVIGLEVQSPRQVKPLAAPIRPGLKSFKPVPGRMPPARAMDPAVYSASADYPARWGDTRIQRMGSANVLILKVYPFKYAGAPARLILFPRPEITLTLSAARWAPDPTPRNIVDVELKKNLVNPDESFFGITTAP